MTSLRPGYYQNELRDLRGRAMVGAVVDVFDVGTTTPATVYSTDTRTAMAASPLPAAAGLNRPGIDTAANIAFYAEDTDGAGAPLEYDVRVTFAGSVFTFRAKPAPSPGGGGASVSPTAELLPAYYYGHSYAVTGGTPGAMYPQRLARRTGVVNSVRSVGGSLGFDVYTEVANGIHSSVAWVPGTTGIVVVDSVLNDVRFFGNSALAINSYADSLRALIALLNAGAKKEQTDGTVTLTGTWSSAPDAADSGSSLHYTNTVGDVADIAYGDNTEVTLLCDLFGGASNSVQFIADPAGANTLLRTSDYTGRLVNDAGSSFPHSFRVAPERFTGLTPNKILRMRNQNAGFMALDAYVTPAANPPTILVMKGLPLANWALGGLYANGSDAALAAFNAAIVSVVAEFEGNVLVVDPSSGWNKNTMLVDGLHPNDLGHAAIAAALASAIEALPARQGQNVL